jgi:hypothetical protein
VTTSLRTRRFHEQATSVWSPSSGPRFSLRGFVRRDHRAAARGRWQPGVAIIIALFVVGCGGTSATTLVRRTATRYVSELQSGDLHGACSLETSETVRLQTQEAVLLSRFSQAARTPCGLEQFFAPSDFSSRSTPRPLRTVVDGKAARVIFPSNALPLVGNTLHLDEFGGRWRVDDASDFRSVQTPAAAASTEEKLFSQSCLSAWNAAVAGGQVTVPSAIENPSTAAWANLDGTNTGIPCSTMSIDDPSSDYCESYVQNQGDGSWLQTPCVTRLAAGQLNRDVWLGAGGTATPAAQASPDGTVPPLISPASVRPTAGAAPSLGVGSATNRKECNPQVATLDGPGGNCTIAETALVALKSAYQQTSQIPAHITVKDPTSGKTLDLSCDLRSGNQEVDCLDQQAVIATFATSGIER